MTEPLYRALTSDVSLDNIVPLLKKDGLNCRESESYDTPLMLAIRHNNLPVIDFILEAAKKSSEKYNILNAVNKTKESPLSIALHHSDKKVALQLIKQGVDIRTPLPSHMENEEKWLAPFYDYVSLQQASQVNSSEQARRGLRACEIAARFYQISSDIEEAIKWFDLSAKDGNAHGMLNLAIIYQNQGRDTQQAVMWFKKSYDLLSENSEKEMVINQLKTLSESSLLEPQAGFLANMTVGLVYAKKGDLANAFYYFKLAKKYFLELPNQKNEYVKFFAGCDFWNGSFYENNIDSKTLLDLAERFNLFVESNTEEAKAIFSGILTGQSSRLLQIIACQLAKPLLSNAKLQILSDLENKPYIQVLTLLYGWDNQPKNVLRAAGLCKKIIETGGQDNETLYLCYVIMSYAYLQQADIIYLLETISLLDKAHEVIAKTQSNFHKECVYIVTHLTIPEQPDAIKAYSTLLLNCYQRETVIFMQEIVLRFLQFGEKLITEIPAIVNVFVTMYKTKKDKLVRANVVDFLTQLKDKFSQDSEQQLLIEKSLADCTQLSIDEKDYAADHLDHAVDSYKKLAEKSDDQEYQKKYFDSLLLRAEASQKEGKFETALQDYHEIYTGTKRIDVLITIAQIETELGMYDDAITHYQIVAEADTTHKRKLLLAMLNDLKRMSEELIERDPRREKLAKPVELFLQKLLVDTKDIETMAVLNDLKTFALIAKNPPEIITILTTLEEKITPLEEARLQKEAAAAEHLRFITKQVDQRGRSAKHYLGILLGLADSEKDNPKSLAIVQQAIHNWIVESVHLENDEIMLSNEPGLIELAQNNYLLAAYQLARYQQQTGNISTAISLYGHILASPEIDNDATMVKQDARNMLKACMATEGGMFSKQKKYIEYAKNIIDVLKDLPAEVEDPDKMIVIGLRSKQPIEGMLPHSQYILDLAKIFGKKESAK